MFSQILQLGCTLAQQSIPSRKRLIEHVSDLVAAQNDTLVARALFDALMSRERLGSTGIGNGVAIPHCRIDCDEIIAVFLTLQEGVDFEAEDDKPVDLVFALVVPQQETERHLQILAKLAEIFSEQANRRTLRNIPSDDALHQQMLELLSSR